MKPYCHKFHYFIACNDWFFIIGKNVTSVLQYLWELQVAYIFCIMSLYLLLWIDKYIKIWKCVGLKMYWVENVLSWKSSALKKYWVENALIWKCSGLKILSWILQNELKYIFISWRVESTLIPVIYDNMKIKSWKFVSKRC